LFFSLVNPYGPACLYLPGGFVPIINPQYAFYRLLLDLFFDDFEAMEGRFDLKLAEKVTVLAETHRNKITLPDVSLGNLERWFEMCHHEDRLKELGQSNVWVGVRDKITSHCLIDLGKQMRNGKVRELYRAWEAYFTTDLRIYIRKVIDLGDGLTAVTLITDNSSWVRGGEFHYQDFFCGGVDYVHLLIAKE